MTDDPSVASVRKPGRPLILLRHSLAQLADDCFDDDQYDQAVEILEKLKVEGLRLPSNIAQKLVTLTLCSLSPGQVASTSKWTYEHQLHDIAVRLLTQPKAKKGAAHTASDRPSETALFRALSLLLEYTEASNTDADSDHNAEGSSGSKHTAALSARLTLKSLPSRRKPLNESQPASSTTPRRARSDSAQSDSEHETSFELSSIERWVRQSLYKAEDAWDLLCDRYFSKSEETEADASVRMGEFWMSNADRKHYQKQLQATDATHQRLADRLRELRRKALNEGMSSDDNSDDDDALEGLSTAARKKKRSAKSKTNPSSAPITKRAREDKPAALLRSDDESQHPHLRMKEGAWRTLSVLLRLWNRASSPTTLTTSMNTDVAAAIDDEPPLLWQFPVGHQVKRNGRSTTKASNGGKDVTDEISRALDIAFSFPRVLPAFTPPSTGTEAASGLFDTATSSKNRGDARLISSVPQTELMHRQKIASQYDGFIMASRAETAARLFVSMNELVKLGHVQPAAFIEGISDRIDALRVHEIEDLMLPLIKTQSYIVAKVLTMYLDDSARTPPNKQKLKAEATVKYHFDNDTSISHGAALAYATPDEESALALLRKTVEQDQDNVARAVLDFLSLDNLEFHSSANSNLALTFPTKSESRKVAVVQKRPQKQAKSDLRPLKKEKTRTSANGNTDAAAAAVVTSKMKKGGLLAFAFLRIVQMQSRARINEIKFLIAQALVTMHGQGSARHANAEVGSSTLSSPLSSSPSSPQVVIDLIDESMKPSATQGPETRKQKLRLFLSQLAKAFSRDAEDFGKCLKAMETHIDSEAAKTHQNGPNDEDASHGDTEGLAALPSMSGMVGKAQAYLETTQNLEQGTEMLRDAMS